MSERLVIGMLGCGTVGSGVLKLLMDKQALFAERAQVEIEVRKVLVRDPSRVREEWVPRELLTTDPDEIFEDPEIQIVVEVMGGVNPAKDYLMMALQSGKHVVTANKALLAQQGDDLFDAANESGAALHFEAAVAGGIPIISALKRGLVSNTLRSVYGIINGTTNYILSAMTEEGRGFEEVLAEAQAKGYAESDPTDDVEGFDAAYKLAILSSLIFNKRIDVKQIHRVGIQSVAAQDIAYAKQFGYTIKLLAIAKRTRNGLEARVNPTMIPADHPLASVNGVYNALLVQGDAVGDLMFYGRGAGQMPTASAIVSDILNIAVEIDSPPNLLMSCQHSENVAQLSAPDHVINRYYLRIQTEDKSGVLGHIGHLLGKEDISIHTLIQTKHRPGEAEIVLITHPVSEQKLRQAVAELRKLETTRRIDSIIRVEDFGQ